MAWEIHKAARECGFFYVKNHGVPQAVVDGAFAAMRSFFEKPLDYKLSVLRDNWPVPRGYEPLFYQQLDAGTPRDVIARLNGEIVKMARAPETVDQFVRQGLELFSSTPDQFAARIKLSLN